MRDVAIPLLLLAAILLQAAKIDRLEKELGVVQEKVDRLTEPMSGKLIRKEILL